MQKPTYCCFAEWMLLCHLQFTKNKEYARFLSYFLFEYVLYASAVMSTNTFVLIYVFIHIRSISLLLATWYFFPLWFHRCNFHDWYLRSLLRDITSILLAIAGATILVPFGPYLVIEAYVKIYFQLMLRYAVTWLKDIVLGKTETVKPVEYSDCMVSIANTLELVLNDVI